MPILFGYFVSKALDDIVFVIFCYRYHHNAHPYNLKRRLSVFHSNFI